MTNTNNAETRARTNPKNGPALYEVSTLEGGTIVVKPTKVSRDVLRVAEQVKDGTTFKARVTE